MSNVARVAGQAANTLTKPLNVEDVFSTYLYSANNAGLTITNGIDLAGEGGLVWGKSRSATQNHRLYDTEGNGLYSNLTNGSFGSSGRFTANSDGFDLTASSGIVGGSGFGGPDYASWTFRKAPKFFDVVTYTGTGSAQNISHNLGSVPGMIIIKSTSNAFNWVVYHRGTDATAPEDYLTYLDLSIGRTNSAGPWNDTAPTATQFTVNTTSAVNFNGGTFVAYLFAHNDGDGEFGPDGDADIIKCGSYSGNGSVQDIDLGFEAQWVLVKNITSSNTTSARWGIYDVMRGMPPITYGAAELNSDQATAERTGYSSITPHANGFTLLNGVTMNNQSNNHYIYMAIRRPTAVPESATDVFGITTYTGNATSGRKITNSGSGVVDLATITADNANRVAARLTGYPFLVRDATDAAINSNTRFEDFDANDGFFIGSNSQVNTSSKAYYALMWTRSPNFFDVVSWKVDGTGDQTINHNLGVVPEMVWSKNRNSTSSTYNWWVVAHKDLTGWDSSNENDRHVLRLDSAASSAQQGYHRDFTSTSIRMLSVASGGYTTTDSVIAYLFASLDGISKVGSYTGDGTTGRVIDCGFTSGARYVLIKRTNATGNWHEFHTGYGIVAGNEQAKYVNTGGDLAGSVTYDLIDPDTSGFIINQETISGSNLNVNGASYIFYAIA